MNKQPSTIPSPILSPAKEIFPPTPTQTLSPINTLNVLEDCSITPGFEEKASHDGLWIAASCYEDHVQIAKIDGTQKWDFDFDQITGVHFRIAFTNKFGELEEFPPLLIVQGWQKDNRHLFIFTSFEMMGFTHDGFGLYRIDAQTGQSEALLPIADTSYAFAFSPNGESYAYAGDSENSLHIVSIETGVDISYEITRPITFVQKLLWTPDSAGLIFVDGILLGENATTSLLMFDLDKKDFFTLLNNSEKRFAPVEWKSAKEVILQNWNDGLKYTFNIETKELKQFSAP
jgi:WD40 repeat protein